jgi:REP element-mobilizing transposase RayT
MSTYTQILYHIVFGTKNHEKTIILANKKELYKYIWGILEHMKCILYRFNGTTDDIHIAMQLHPSVALSSLIKDVKMATVEYNKKWALFPSFNGWQDGYAAFTLSYSEKDRLIEYIKNQEEHHKTKTFQEEYFELLKEQGLELSEAISRRKE